MSAEDAKVNIEIGVDEFLRLLDEAKTQVVQLQAALDSATAADVTEDAAYEDQLTLLRSKLATSIEDYSILQAHQAVTESELESLVTEYALYRERHPQTSFEMVDFAQQGMGLWLGATKPPNVDVIRMKASSSTKGSIINALTKPNTNQYRLMMAGGNSSATGMGAIDLGNFVLDGNPDQGHAFGGLRLGYSTGAKLHDIGIYAIPGFDSSPPGETFGLALFHADSAKLDRVTVDGRNIDGVPVTATAVGYNYTTGVTVANLLKANYAKYGFAVALWQCSGTQIFNDCDFRFCRKAINIEQSVGGVYEFNRCDFRGLEWTRGAQITSITKSSLVTFRDPVVDVYPFKVRTFGTSALGGLNVQRDVDIKCFMDGVDVTADPTKFQIVRTD